MSFKCDSANEIIIALSPTAISSNIFNLHLKFLEYNPAIFPYIMEFRQNELGVASFDEPLVVSKGALGDSPLLSTEVCEVENSGVSRAALYPLFDFDVSPVLKN